MSTAPRRLGVTKGRRRSGSVGVVAAVLVVAFLGGEHVWDAAAPRLADAWDAAAGVVRADVVPAPAATTDASVAALVVDDSASDVPAYDRELFGPTWADVDHNGCDQRNDTLSAYLVDVIYRVGTRDCVVETGTFTDPYTGEIRPFVKSEAGGGVDIDHLVPLEHAWQSGAWAWTAEQRAAYANDLDLLVPTDASLNRSKGSQDVTTWLPPVDGGYVCTYLERWVEVKTAWKLTVTSDELAALSAGLASCEA